MAAPSPIVQAVTRELAKYPRLDPRAVLAVASQEGLSGAIGDQGTSYGPWQLHKGGAYPGSAPQDPGQAQQWALSPAGIDYALGRIQTVAGGEKGQRAVTDIVSRFERPANPGREIAGALGAYGTSPAPQNQTSPLAAAAAPMQAAAPPPQIDFRPQLASELASAGGTPGNDLSGFYSTLAQALRQRQATPAAAPQSRQSAPLRPLPATSGQTVPLNGLVAGNTKGEQPAFLNDLAELARFEHAPVDINSGYRSLADQTRLWNQRASNPNPVAAPGHSLHEQGLAADGTVGGKPLGTLPAAILRRFGLMPVPGDPVHVQLAR